MGKPNTQHATRSMMHGLGLAVLGALAVAALAPADAAAQSASSAQRAACTPDVFRLCSGDIPNVSKITACLRRERPRLSSACGSVMDAADRQVASARGFASDRDGATQ